MHPLLKPYNLFDINGVAILSGFHDVVLSGAVDDMGIKMSPKQFPSGM